MGCDIRMRVELLDWYTMPDGTESKEQAWRTVMTEAASYGARNYSVFAALADVRNYQSQIAPITQPRGIPEDASPDTKTEHARWTSDAHSASWLTLAEVLAYNWGEVPHASEFWAWAKSLRDGPTRLHFRDTTRIRLVFWFDN